MAKIKYYYDPETLSYRAIETSKVRQFSNLLLFFFTALIFGISGLFLLLNTSWLNTPTELAQERELDNYKLQFDILNRRLGQL